jgi:Uma2 family endonuclease
MSTVALSLDGIALRERVRKEGRVLLAGVSWEAYKTLLDSVGNTSFPHTYDRGRLELMVKSREHELYRSLLGRFAEVWADENLIPLEYGGEMTLQREDVERGVEGDECYWIQNESKVRGKMVLDFITDPPPDLVIEAEVSTTILSRLPVYSALRVPEIWRVSEAGIRVGRLQADGQYEWCEQSTVFPNFPMAEIPRFFAMVGSTDNQSIVRAFRTWVRQHLGR